MRAALGGGGFACSEMRLRSGLVFALFAAAARLVGAQTCTAASASADVVVALLFDLQDVGEDMDDVWQEQVARSAVDHVNADATVLDGQTMEAVTCDTAAIRVLGSDDSSHIQQLFQNERTAIGENVQSSGAVAALGTAWSSDVVHLYPVLVRAQQRNIVQILILAIICSACLCSV